MTTQRPTSGMFCSSSTWPARIRTSNSSTWPTPALRPTSECRALGAQVDGAGDGTGRRALVGRVHLAVDAAQDILVDGGLQLLRGVIRPHGKHVQIALNFHDVIEDQREIFAVPDVELNRATGRAVKREQAVGQVVADGDGRLGADLDAVALVFDLAFVVGVGD